MSIALDRPDILAALVTAGRLSPQEAEHARSSALHVGKAPEFVAVDLGLAPERLIIEQLALAGGFQVWSPSEIATDDALVRKLSPAFLRDHLALPLHSDADHVVVAVADPFDQECLAGLQFAFGKRLELRLASAADIRAALARGQNAEPRGAPRSRDLSALSDATSSAPAAVSLQALLSNAAQQRASDVHIEMGERMARVRIRVDGVLLDVGEVETALAAAMISRVKVLSDLNVAEARLPQDGRVTLAVRGAQIDVRVATTPTIHGESLTLRLLNRAGSLRAIGDLDLGAREHALLERVFRQRQGLFLVAGPTGSGKTTTLYAGLQLLRNKGLKIISIEDPVEYQFDHVTQIQVAPQIGLGFSTSLRAILRHDPDVIMVGEIRDPETAKIAIQAALTGHLVVASIHARDALRAPSRLQEMGVEPYQLSAALAGCIAQRLLRRVCLECAQPSSPSTQQLAVMHQAGFAPPSDPRWLLGAGCASCNGVGYRGRVAAAEGLIVSDIVSDALSTSASSSTLLHLAEAEGYHPLRVDALAKAAAGLTSVEEVISILGDA